MAVMDVTGRVRPRLGWPTMVAFGMGSMASAYKNRAMAVFLLIYYNQVIGLSPGLVSSLIFVTVLFDALFDPLVGQISDNFRSRLGRRHPFMYFAAVPASVLFFMLWNPPLGWSDGAIAGYFFTCLLLLKLFDTFFELPAHALLPELVQEYDKRTRWIATRSFFGNGTNLLTTVLAYSYFLAEAADGSGGVLSREGYFNFSLVGAVLMFITVMLASLATHRQIPWLVNGRANTPSIPQMFREAFATVRNRSFLAILLAGMCTAINVGLKGALDVYWYLYLFGLKQTQMANITLIGTGGTILGFILGPMLIKRFGKKHTAMFMLAASVILTTGPTTLWLLNLTPPNGSDWLFVLLAADQLVNSGVWFCLGLCTAAMVADIVEDNEVKTGRRAEGVLFSSQSLFNKMIGGLGPLSAGVVLTLASFPRDAERGTVSEELLGGLAMTWIPVVIVVRMAAIGALTLYAISRTKHEENLAILRARRGDSPGAAPAPAE